MRLQLGREWRHYKLASGLNENAQMVRVNFGMPFSKKKLKPFVNGKVGQVFVGDHVNSLSHTHTQRVGTGYVIIEIP